MGVICHFNPRPLTFLIYLSGDYSLDRKPLDRNPIDRNPIDRNFIKNRLDKIKTIPIPAPNPNPNGSN